MITATEDHIRTINARAFNEMARAMMREGVALTHAQGDELGDEAFDWMQRRLGLVIRFWPSGIKAFADKYYHREDCSEESDR